MAAENLVLNPKLFLALKYIRHLDKTAYILKKTISIRNNFVNATLILM